MAQKKIEVEVGAVVSSWFQDFEATTTEKTGQKFMVTIPKDFAEMLRVIDANVAKITNGSVDEYVLIIPRSVVNNLRKEKT